MAARLNPYISFNGNAREAMGFYATVFGGEPQLMTFSTYEQEPSPLSDKIMHGSLETPSGFALMGADTPPGGGEFERGNAMSVSVSGDDDAELHGYFDKLADGGNITVPLEKQMWGDVFGMVTDKFGITWLVNIAEPGGGAPA
jgi:PhnB protein